MFFKKILRMGTQKLKNSKNSITSEITSKTSGKKLIDEGIKHAPDLYKIGTSKIKNKNSKSS